MSTFCEDGDFFQKSMISRELQMVEKLQEINAFLQSQHFTSTTTVNSKGENRAALRLVLDSYATDYPLESERVVKVLQATYPAKQNTGGSHHQPMTERQSDAGTSIPSMDTAYLSFLSYMREPQFFPLLVSIDTFAQQSLADEVQLSSDAQDAFSSQTRRDALRKSVRDFLLSAASYYKGTPAQRSQSLSHLLTLITRRIKHISECEDNAGKDEDMIASATINELSKRPQETARALRLPPGALSDRAVQVAVDELKDMGSSSSPAYKANAVLNCCRVLSLTLEKSANLDSDSNRRKSVGADLLLPALMYTIVKANITNLHSQLEYCHQYLGKNASMGSAGYALVSCRGALELLQEIDLNIPSSPPSPPNCYDGLGPVE